MAWASVNPRIDGFQEFGHKRPPRQVANNDLSRIQENYSPVCLSVLALSYGVTRITRAS